MVEERKLKKRIVSLDVTRALAIFFVVLCHAVEPIYTYGIPPNNSSKIISILAFTVGRIGVPLFLFLTGALILKKQINDDKGVLHFYKKSLLPLIIVNIVWVLIYSIFFTLSGRSDEVTIDAIIKEIFLVKTVPLPNMWYMPIIIGMYIGLPFVAKIVKTFSKKGLALATIVVFIFCFIVPFVNVILSMCSIEEKWLLSMPLDLSFLGGAYGLYILIGYMLVNEKIKIKLIWLLIIMLSSFGVTWLIQFISKSEGAHYMYNVWYNFPFLLICSACLFIIINRINYKKLSKTVINIITFISKASLGIFFLHIIVQWILSPHILALNIVSPVKLLLLLFSNFVICAIICYAISKIKFLARWVLLMK